MYLAMRDCNAHNVPTVELGDRFHNLYSTTNDCIRNNYPNAEGNLLAVHVAEIKMECVDHSYDFTAGFRVEETAVPANFVTTKCEAEEELCSLDTVKDDLKVEVMREENEILTDSLADPHHHTVSTYSEGFEHEEYTSAYQPPKHCVWLPNILRDHEDKKEFKCNVCGKCFSQSKQLKTHENRHNDIRTFIPRSNVTGKSSFIQFTQEKHEQQLTDRKSLKCEVCGKSFTESSALKRHVRKHTGEKPFKCDICGKSFSEAGTLTSHTRQHTGDKPFKCDICGKCFTQRSSLNCHARQHTGDKPFKCQVCGKCFFTSSDLKRHARMHTAQKPFTCKFCEKCFKYSNSLRVHERKHAGKEVFKCDVCDKSFLNRESIKQHVLIHIA
ncbi:hypothetical protein ANN_27712 [Periplaneta americana]|uniref:C2H2-type domain-containing protein n=1 Tax=Periplaneta americana TaxID=6978 RepID=A0ABQ8RUX4_PERAM|nr:hypothetical protein ANN_27712 [Periplaneta americana]